MASRRGGRRRGRPWPRGGAIVVRSLLRRKAEPLGRHTRSAVTGRNVSPPNGWPSATKSCSALLALALFASGCGRSEETVGKILYVTCPSETNCEFVRIQADGSNREVVFELKDFEGVPPLLPDCSPDGKNILFFTGTGKPSVYEANLPTGKVRDLTPDLNAVDPDWSPAGTQVVFSVIETSSGSPEIWVMNQDGSQAHPLATDSVIGLVPAWSPDGASIAYTLPISGGPSGADIWVVGSDGSKPEPWVEGSGGDRQPAWSPDGNSMAFTRVGEGPSGPRPGLAGEIYIADRSGTTVRRLVEGNPPKFFPDWSQKGDRIVVSTGPEANEGLGKRDVRYQLYTVNADGSELRQITTEPNGAHFGTWC